MRIVLYVLTGLAGVLIAGAVFVFVAAPTGYVRDRLIAEVKLRTGRDLAVAGGASFSIYPRLGVELEDVSLSGPPGLEKEAFIHMERLRLAIPLLPLMQRKLAIEELVLVRPVIQLAVDDKGRRTWDFTFRDASAAKEVAPLQSPETSSGQTDTAPATSSSRSTDGATGQLSETLAGLSLGDVRIEQGEIRYANLLTKSRQRLTEVDVRLALSRIDAPFEATGSLVWRKQKLPFKARLETLKTFLDGSAARLVLALDAELLDASYDGKLDIAGVALLDGTIDITCDSLRDVAKWAGTKLPAIGGLGPLDLAGHVTVAGPVYGLTKAQLSLDGAKATGELTLDTGGARPRFAGTIAIDRLNLNTYLADAPAGTKTAESQAATDVDETASVSTTADPIKPAKSKRSRAGWSTDPIETAGLKAIDAEVTISAGALLFQDIKIGKSRIVLSLSDGLLKARLPELVAYGGKGLGALMVDGQTAVPRLTGNVTINSVSALPLLTDAMAFDWIAGEGSISLGFKTEGRSQKAWVQALTGQGRFAFTDGAIVGLNIPQMVRGLGKGRASALDRDKSLKTDFSELGGTFIIDQGIVTNKDLNLVGPLIRVAGAGTIDLPAQSLDYAAMPKIVASLEGQGGGDATGFTIPVRIQGPWAKPKIVPDLEGLAKNPEAIADTVKQLGAKLKDSDKKKVSKALEKLTGGKSSSEVENLIGGVLGQ